MLEGINVEQIKSYNSSLRQHKERASKLRAEIDFNTKELNRVCAELSEDLGIEVTPDNIEQIYADKVAKINNTLQTGTEILRRVAEEEMAKNQPTTPVVAQGAVSQLGQQPVQPVVQAPVFNNVPDETIQI